jgi:penicillin-binding protein 1A
LIRLIPAATAGIVALVLIAGAAGGALAWRWAFNDLPALPESSAELWEVRRERSVTLLAADGSELAVRGPRYARPVTLDELPAHVPQAFIAIEDVRFYDHDGVDRRGLARAVIANIQARSAVQGGSTLTMQLIKNLVLSPERTVRRKVQEIRLALALEERLSKQEILELYLNRVYLGERAFGIEAASWRYFNKPAADLTLAEAALLAALPKAPSRLAPTVNMEDARARARSVLLAMVEAGFITSLDYIGAVAEPATLAEPESDPRDPALFGHVFDHALARAEAELGEDLPDVVTLQTTLDPDLQAAAQGALAAVMNEQGEARNAGEAALLAIGLDGSVRAMIGGRDYQTSQFNRTTQALRQPGSAFKPIVFAAAFENGMDPATAFRDRPIDIEGWSPENYGGGYRGRITIADALKRSINTVAAQVGAEIGPEAIAEMATRLGVTTPINPVPALSLGTGEVRLIDMVGVFAAFANDGRRTQPILLAEVRNARGDLLWAAPERTPGRPVLEPEHARAMSTMMQSVLVDGTGTRARLANRRAAGKTGTSQDSRDAWFVGYTAQLAAGVWVGNDDDTPTDSVTGGQLPAEIWRRFMTEAHRGLPAEPLRAREPQRRTEREESLAAFYSDLSARFDAVIDPASD